MSRVTLPAGGHEYLSPGCISAPPVVKQVLKKRKIGECYVYFILFKKDVEVVHVKLSTECGTVSVMLLPW